MKKLFLLLLLCIGMTTSYAQTDQNKSPMTAEQKADEAVTKLKTELALSDDQVTKVKAITVEKINKVTAAHKKIGADKSRLNSANKQIYDEWEVKLKTILTPDQYNKYLASKGQ
jgi:predicted S18 family serine protease